MDNKPDRQFWEGQIGKPHTFYAVYTGFDEKDDKRNNKYKKAHKIRYMMLENVITEDGVRFRGHLWLPMGKRFRKMGLEYGTIVRFQAKVNTYVKFGTQKTYGNVWVYIVDDEGERKEQMDLKNINDFEIVDTPPEELAGELVVDVEEDEYGEFDPSEDDENGTLYD